MPCHPDRVRRDYVTTTVIEQHNIQNNEISFQFIVTKIDIASWPSAREMKHNIILNVYKLFEKALPNK